MNYSGPSSPHPSSLIPFRMWNDRLRIAESVLPQWNALTAEEKAAVRRTLEVIDEDPIIGAPLFDPLKGYWSFLVDGLRILYRIVADARFVVILSITRQ
jgi:mRNA-degrading endonuclease RelE of RelBE toxin-antitoxin system